MSVFHKYYHMLNSLGVCHPSSFPLLLGRILVGLAQLSDLRLSSFIITFLVCICMIYKETTWYKPTNLLQTNIIAICLNVLVYALCTGFS